MIDLVKMIENVGKSLIQLQELITAFGYMLGILLIINGIYKLKSTFAAHESFGAPLMLILGGASLLFLPSMLTMWSVTFFSVYSPLQYDDTAVDNLIPTMEVIIQTMGLIWFIKGTVMIAHLEEPGNDEERNHLKAVIAIIAGILAANIIPTISWLTYVMDQIIVAL